jgi:co-chaperonin GroES (HSP10)
VMIHPIQSRLLVELKSKYKHINPTEEKFGTSKTQGLLKAIAPDIEKQAAGAGLKVGQVVYFGKYEDTAPYDVDGVDHALIKLEEIGGWSDES